MIESCWDGNVCTSSVSCDGVLQVTGVLDSLYREECEDLIKRHNGRVTKVGRGWEVVCLQPAAGSGSAKQSST